MQLTSIKCIHAPRGIWPNLATVLLGTYIYIYSFFLKKLLYTDRLATALWVEPFHDSS